MMKQGTSTAWVQGMIVKPAGLSRGASHCPLRRHVARNPGARPATASVGYTRGPSMCEGASPSIDAGKASASWDGSQINADALIERVKFGPAGLVAAVTQQVGTNEVLMMAWMSEESIRETMGSGRAVYFSRSRQKLWRKGDTSGQVQYVRDVLLDCDGDTILLVVDQIGVACHTGRRSCFYTAFRPPRGEPEIIADVLVDPNEMYGSHPQ